MIAAPADGKPWVIIFRLQLFKPSETFILAQAQALDRYRPLYVGWRSLGAGPPGAAAVCPRSRLRALALCVFGDPGPVLARTGGVAPAVVHAHFGVDGVFAAPLARRLGAPLVVTLHGFDVSRRWRSLLASGRPALIAYVLGWRRLTQGAALFLAVSDAVAEAARRRGAAAGRVRVHRTGVDVDRLRPRGAAVHGPVVYVGRLVQKKGVEALVDAFAAVIARRPDARLVLIGEGPQRSRIDRRVRRRGLFHAVQRLGALPHAEALDWMARAAVVAVPSLRARNGDAEGLPTTALEAAALGRPLLASDVAGLANTFEPGREAQFARSGDPRSLAAALETLLADPEAAERLGEAARRRVEVDHHLQRQTARLETLYDALARRHG